jgi:hypothetical protein
MGKVITSPVQRWPGTVTLSDPLTYPQMIKLERAIEAGRRLKADPEAGQGEYAYALLPGLCACVEAWSLTGLDDVTPDTFPATPRAPAARLLAWLLDAVTALYQEDDGPPA